MFGIKLKLMAIKVKGDKAQVEVTYRSFKVIDGRIFGEIAEILLRSALLT